jgi:hypothetical protein
MQKGLSGRYQFKSSGLPAILAEVFVVLSILTGHVTRKYLD